MNSMRHGLRVLIIAGLMTAAAMAHAEDKSATATLASADLAAHYIAIQTALAGDTLDGVPDRASALRDLAAAARDAAPRGDGSSAASVATASAKLAGTDDIAAAPDIGCGAPASGNRISACDISATDI